MLLIAQSLAQADPGRVSGTTPGLVLLLLMLIATFLLIRNMSGRLGRLPSTFEAPDEGDAPPDDDEQPAGTRDHRS